MRGMIAGLFAATLLLAACGPKEPAKIDDEALMALSDTVADQLNEVPAAIMTLLRAANDEPQVGWDTLVLNVDQPEPIGWWMMKRGFIEFSGAQFAARAAFTLTKPAQDLIAQADQPWFEVEATGEPKVDCNSPVAMTAHGCEVEVEVTPTLTPAGKAAAGDVKLNPFTVHAVVTLGPEDWEIINLTTATAPPSQIAADAILGPKESRDAQQKQATEGLKGRLSSLAGETAAPVNLDAWTPPNYVEPPPPLAPLEPPPPSSRPDTPFRPGG